MGLMIVFEGLDAAGKATQAKLLAERINRTGREAVIFSFPRYETVLGKAILQHLKGEIAVRQEHAIDSANVRIDGDIVHRVAPEDALVFQCMCVADKCEAAGEILKHLRAGRFVICDRWTPSAQAFGAADGLDRTWLDQVQAQLPKADLYLWLNVPPEEALRRRPQMRDRYEKDRAKQAVIRENYEQLWADHQYPGDVVQRWVKLDGTGTVSDVHERVWDTLRTHWRTVDVADGAA